MQSLGDRDEVNAVAGKASVLGARLPVLQVGDLHCLLQLFNTVVASCDPASRSIAFLCCVNSISLRTIAVQLATGSIRDFFPAT